jgi:hypothetical protein
MILFVLFQLVLNDYFFDNANFFHKEAYSLNEFAKTSLNSAVYPFQAFELSKQSAWIDTSTTHHFLSNERQHLFAYGNAKESIRIGMNIYAENLFESKAAFNLNSSYYLSGKVDNFYFHMEKFENFAIGNKNIVAKNSVFSKSNYQEKHLEESNSFDLSFGHLIYAFNKSYLFLGKIPWEIGYGESGKLILNGFKQHYPITAFGLNLDLGIFRYHAMHGQLLASELLEFRNDSLNGDLVHGRQMPDKFMVSHRFEIDLSKNVVLAMNELIVYGNRSVDLNYLNPFHFVKPVEHELQDRDNALIALSVKFRIPQLNIISYHEILLDEWKISELSSYFSSKEHWFGNKQAMLNGISYRNNNWQVFLELVQIAPYVYTHKFAVNRYSHDALPLGYDTGPNSLSYFFKCQYLSDDEYSLSFSYRHVKKGNNYSAVERNDWNIGGDLFHGDNTRAKETRRFLEGKIFLEDQIQLNFKYQLHNNFILYSNHKISNSKWNSNNGLVFLF